MAQQAFLRLLVWGCARPHWNEIELSIRKIATVHGSAEALHVHMFDAFVRKVYAIDDVSAESIDAKLVALKACPPEVLSVLIRVDPDYRVKGASGQPISRTMEKLKARIRSDYKQRVPNYKHDIIIHGTDNERHTRHVDRQLGQHWIETDQCDTTNRWACTDERMRALNVSNDDWMVVGSSVLDLSNVPDIDILVHPSKHSLLARLSHKQSGVVSPGWLSRVASDDAMLRDEKWHGWTLGARRVMYVHREHAIVKKLITRRRKDLDHLQTVCSHPFAYNLERFQAAASSANVGARAPCAPVEGSNCTHTLECNACLSKPGCAYCQNGDFGTCFHSEDMYCHATMRNLRRNARVISERVLCARSPATTTCTHLAPCSFPLRLNQCCTIRTRDLLEKHTVNGSFQRMDVVLRVMAAEGILKGDATAEHWYTRHVAHRTKQDGPTRLALFKELLSDVSANGLKLNQHPIPVSLSGRLIEGSHRLALALLLQLGEITVVGMRGGGGGGNQDATYIDRVTGHNIGVGKLESEYSRFAARLPM